jgi:hypothetical protein
MHPGSSLEIAFDSYDKVEDHRSSKPKLLSTLLGKENLKPFLDLKANFSMFAYARVHGQHTPKLKVPTFCL